MAQKNELQAPKLHHMLALAFPDLKVSENTVKMARRELGLVVKKKAILCSNVRVQPGEATGMQYGVSSIKRVHGGLECEDSLWTDGCTVQQESHCGISRKKLSGTRGNQNTHPRSACGLGYSVVVVVFSAMLTATRYVDILEVKLLPFLET